MLVSLLVCLIPTTIGGLLSAIGIAGMDRLVQHNVLAMSGRAVEAAGDVNTLLLDKTGTITLGNRQASRFVPAPGVTEQNWLTPPSCRRWPMKLPKAAPSSFWPKKSTHCGAGNLPLTKPRSFPLPRRLACLEWTSTALRFARARPTRLTPYLTQNGNRVPMEVRAVVEQIAPFRGHTACSGGE